VTLLVDHQPLLREPTRAQIEARVCPFQRTAKAP